MRPFWSYDRDSDAQAQPFSPQLGALLEYGAHHFPDKVAIADHRNEWTFSDIHRISQQVATLLREEYQLEAGQAVLLLTTKHCLVPVIAIALWRLGAVYVPVDGDSPEDRVKGIAANVKPRILLNFTEKSPLLDEGPVCLNLAELMERSQGYALSEASPLYQHQPDDVAYIIHTSGSTGVPKGVQISADSLKHYFYAHNQVLRFNENARVFSLSPFHFDVSIEDTILPLSVGAFVYQYNRLHQGRIIRNTLIKQKATHLIAVSTILTLMSEERDAICRDNFPDLEMVMTGAEVCAPKVINLWKKALPETRVINAYGPTEVTIVSTCFTIDQVEENRETAYPIGQPLAGVDVLLLDEQGIEVPKGEAGELCLGGAQVMSGYLNRPDEDKKRLFVHNGVRFYRSGDICFINEEGDIQFVGRNDSEVKLNGRRIHLGEVQQQCLSLDHVERAAVGIIENDGQAQIGAVIVSAHADAVEQVEAHLQKVLPGYMVPMIWGAAHAVSLSSSGKTDDKVLLQKLSQAHQVEHKKVHQL